MVGKYFQEGRTSWVPGSFFTMVGPECRLDLFWDNISSEDVWRVSNGKVSFGAEKLFTNLDTVMDAIAKAKPAAAKGTYFKSATIATTMGPGIRLNTLKYGV